jgi:hypothetical protein
LGGKPGKWLAKKNPELSKIINNPTPNNSRIQFDWKNNTSSPAFESVENLSVFDLKSCFVDIFNEP